MSTEEAQIIGQRLKEEVERLGSAISVAQKLGVSRNTLGNWYATAALDAVQCAQLEELGADIRYIISGVRSKYSETHLSSEDVASGLDYGRASKGTTAVKVGNNTYTVDPDDYRYIPFYDVEFGAGGGRVVHFDKPPKAFNAYRRDFLRDIGLLDADLFEATSIGDSMFPKIKNADIIMVNASDKVIRSGDIYALQIGDEFICKYLRRLPGGLIEVFSENSKVHAPFTVRESEFDNGVSIVGCLVPLGRY